MEFVELTLILIIYLICIIYKVRVNLLREKRKNLSFTFRVSLGET